MKFKRVRQYSGTHRIGYAGISFVDLHKALGPPTILRKGSDSKVTWAFSVYDDVRKTKQIYTIYDNNLGDEEKAEDNLLWDIGGTRNGTSVFSLKEILPTALLSTDFWPVYNKVYPFKKEATNMKTNKAKYSALARLKATAINWDYKLDPPDDPNERWNDHVGDAINEAVWRLEKALKPLTKEILVRLNRAAASKPIAFDEVKVSDFDFVDSVGEEGYEQHEFSIELGHGNIASNRIDEIRRLIISKLPQYLGRVFKHRPVLKKIADDKTDGLYIEYSLSPTEADAGIRFIINVDKDVPVLLNVAFQVGMETPSNDYDGPEPDDYY